MWSNRRLVSLAGLELVLLVLLRVVPESKPEMLISPPGHCWCHGKAGGWVSAAAPSEGARDWHR